MDHSYIFGFDGIRGIGDGFPEYANQEAVEKRESRQKSETPAPKGRGNHSRKILVKVRMMWLGSIPDGRQREIAAYILDKHGNQMPYDRQYWSYAYKSNRLSGIDEQTKCNLDKGVETLRRYVMQVERAGEIVRSFMLDSERSKQIPSDLTDDYLKQWLSGSNAVLIRKLINQEAEVRDVQLPPCLHADNLARALNHGGLLVRIPPHSQKSFDYFNLLSPGRGDTRHTGLSIPDGGIDIDVKKSRTQLAFPPSYFPEHVPLPKVCVFQIDAKLELLLFYKGNAQKRPRRGIQYEQVDDNLRSGPVHPDMHSTTADDVLNFVCRGNTQMMGPLRGCQVMPDGTHGMIEDTWLVYCPDDSSVLLRTDSVTRTVMGATHSSYPRGM